MTKPEVHPCKPGSATLPFPGFDVKVFDEEGKECPKGTHGFVVCKLPQPPSFMSTLWRNDEAFIEKYMSAYKGYYMTGDAGYFGEEFGHLHIMARIDDVMNTAGHRLSTAQIEECLLSHTALAEAAVVGGYDNLKGEIPVALIVLKSTFDGDIDTLKKELVQIVRKDIGPVACFTTSMVVDSLPKTRSGKILRGTLKKMLNGIEYNTPATIQDVTVLPVITEIMKKNGYGVKKEITFEENKVELDASKHAGYDEVKRPKEGNMDMETEKDWPVRKQSKDSGNAN